MSELFHLLSRGGAKFDKKRFRNEVELFNVRTMNVPGALNSYALGSSVLICSYHTQPKKIKGQAEPEKKKFVGGGGIPAELDFFKYAQGSKGDGAGEKKKTGKERGKGKGKEREAVDVEEEGDDLSGSEIDSDSGMGRKRKRGEDEEDEDEDGDGEKDGLSAALLSLRRY